tara:strand:- start:1268 stop:2869 length:1602 start_codon:yes stop_codon:yes gene_type:complete
LKGLISFAAFIFHSICFPNNIKSVPFDWGNQFGYLNIDGMVMWGEDWESKNLFFDGSWAIFPMMYGNEIAENFQKKRESSAVLDSPDVVSKIDYQQGDYGYDKFSIGIDYTAKNRLIQLLGFKRSFVGNYNQYYANTLQPQHQSYILCTKFSDTYRNTGLSLGHFNTYSGFPDTLTNGLFDNRITSLNYFLEKIVGSASINFQVDQFLQRYKAIHSLSIYEKPRYLGRSRYILELSYLINQIPFIVGFEKNSRFSYFDNNKDVGWNDLYSSFKWNNVKIHSSAIQYRNQNFFNYSIILNKGFDFVNIVVENTTRILPIHPFYLHNYDINQYNHFYKKYFKLCLVEWSVKNNKISFALSMTEDNQSLGSENLKMPNKYNNLNLSYSKKFTSSFNAYISYNRIDTGNYYSGGVGSEVALKLLSKFSLFNNFMAVELVSDFSHLFNRVNYSMINPIEMVPMVINESDHRNLPPISLIDITMRTKVSTVMFEFQWINVSEIILATLQSEKNNFILIHPTMPYLGRQINFSINWEFKD